MAQLILSINSKKSLKMVALPSKNTGVKNARFKCPCCAYVCVYVCVHVFCVAVCVSTCVHVSVFLCMCVHVYLCNHTRESKPFNPLPQTSLKLRKR